MQIHLIKNIQKPIIGIFLLLSFTCVAENKVERALVGNVENGRYISRDKSFSFKLPIEGSREMILNAITDTLSPAAEVIVIKSEHNSTDYRFEISHALPGKEKNSNFTQATVKTFDWYRRLIRRAWKAPITEIVFTEFELHGHKAAHAIYKQFADNASGPRYHVFYLADYDNRIHFLWVNISLTKEDLEIENTIIEASSGPALKAKQSFLSFQLN